MMALRMDSRKLWAAVILAVFALAALCGCSHRTEPGKATAVYAEIDNTEGAGPVEMPLEALGLPMGGIDPLILPQGARVKLVHSEAIQPTPPDEPAVAKAESKGSSADTGKAGKRSQAMEGINILYWLGAATILLGMFLLIASFNPKLRRLLGPIPKWGGPLVSGGGVVMTFIPAVVEESAGLIASCIGIACALVIVGLVAYAWRHREHLLGDLDNNGKIEVR
jgi:hypothetical protein